MSKAGKMINLIEFVTAQVRYLFDKSTTRAWAAFECLNPRSDFLTLLGQSTDQMLA